MAENKKDGQAAAKSEVEKALIQALEDDMGEIPEVSITVDELKALESADRKKRRKRAVRYVSVAAIAAIVCAAVVYVAWPETAVPVDADKNTEQRVETGDGEIVINEGDGVGESGMTEIEETSWDNVEKIRESVPLLGIPQYVPTKYMFNKLRVEIYETNGEYAQYIYINTGRKLYISQRIYSKDSNMAKTSVLQGENRIVSTKRGDVYITSEDNDSLIGINYNENGYVEVKGNIEEKELIKIIEQISMP